MTARLVHLAAGVAWLAVLLRETVPLHVHDVAYLRTRDLVVAGLGAVVVGLCLSGTRRPWSLTWSGLALASLGTVALLVVQARTVERVDFAFVAGQPEHGLPALAAALLAGLAVGLLAALRR